MAQSFALLLGKLSFGYIHGDTDIITEFSSRISLSYGMQESDLAVVGTTNAKFADIVIRSCADCIFNSCPHHRLVFRVESGPKAFEWSRPLAGIEAVYAKRFVR